ncbi:MAG: helix-turn-helix domain-containing protein [Planctomycetaceae bacterium]|nr:helix-turn-helix domain-containing protein [Planctomycetaceae bacterium]
MNLDDRLYTSQEAALVLHVSVRKLWSMTVPRGPLPCVRIGASVRFDPDDLRELIRSIKQLPFDKCNPTKEPHQHGKPFNK